MNSSIRSLPGRLIQTLRQSSLWPDGPLQWAGFGLSVAAFGTLIAYVAAHAVNAPFGEGWHYAETVAIPAYDGTFPLSQVFDQYIDDRIFTLRLIIFASTALTRWNVQTHAVAAVIQAAIIFGCVFDIVRHNDPRRAWIAAGPMAWLVFAINLSTIWLRQYNDIVFSFVFATVGIWVISTGAPGWRRMAACTAFGLCASFSSFAGLLSWFALVITLWAVGYRKPRYYWLWAVGFSAAILLYFIDFEFSGLTRFGNPLIKVAEFELALLGSVFTRDTTLAPWLGGVGVTLAAVELWLLRRTENFGRRVGPWLGLMAFGGMVAFTIATARTHYGILYAVFQPHYSLMAVPFWTGVTALGFMSAAELEKRIGRAAWVGAASIGAVLAALYAQVNIQAASKFTLYGGDLPYFIQAEGNLPYAATQADIDCLRRVVISDDTGCMHHGYFFGPEREPIVIELAERRLGPFGERPDIRAVMPPQYQGGDRVVVVAPLAAQHIPLSDEKGFDVPPGFTVHVMNSDQRDLFMMDLTCCGAQSFANASLSELIEGANRVWVLATKDASAEEMAKLARLLETFSGADAGLDRVEQDRMLYPMVKIYQRKP